MVYLVFEILASGYFRICFIEIFLFRRSYFLLLLSLVLALFSTCGYFKVLQLFHQNIPNLMDDSFIYVNGFLTKGEQIDFSRYFIM